MKEPQGTSQEEAEILTAKALALGGRNGVEDLHAGPEGLFTDEQAPFLNRALRRHLYEALLALRLGLDEQAPNRSWFEGYVFELIDEQDADEAVDRAALSRACRNAIGEFAAASGLDNRAAARLEEAAVGGMLEHLDLMKGAGGDDSTAAQAQLMVMMIPSYWEAPTPSPEFQAQLDRAGAADPPHPDSC